MEVTITKLNHEGKGITKIDNKITFIPNILTKEVADIEITKEYKKFNLGKVTKYISTSDSRVVPACPYYGVCGGCNIMHMSYCAQLDFKKDKVKNILEKYAGIVTDLEIVPSDKVLNYRNKVTLHISNNKVGYMKEGTNEVINIEKCLLLDNRLNEEIDNISDKTNDSYVIRTNGSDVISNEKNGYLIMNINDYKFRIDIKSFFQVNSYICGLLFKELESNLDTTNNVLDLYSGVGTLSIVSSKKAKKVLSIEVNKNSYMNAVANLELNNIDNVDFMCGKVEDLIDKISVKPDVIITDPPRSGMDKKTINVIKEFLPNKIIYISCEAMTLARDIKLLSEEYTLNKVKCFDMFPNTYHVETVVLLSHKKPDGHINVKVEFGEGEGKVPLDNIAKRAEEYKPKERVTYKMIKEYIEAKYGFKVHTAYIAEVKRDLGLPMYDAPNAVEELKQPRKHPTAEKVEAIKDALKHFEVI